MVFAQAVLVALALLMPAAHAYCTASVSSDRLAGCSFNPLLLVVARSGWVLSRQNCGERIDPRAFEDPAVLYYDLAEPDHLYTVAFVAEPATSTGRYLQWLVVNVPVSKYDQKVPRFASSAVEIREQIEPADGKDGFCCRL